jgi:hypothetical protein
VTKKLSKILSNMAKFIDSEKSSETFNSDDSWVKNYQTLEIENVEDIY